MNQNTNLINKTNAQAIKVLSSEVVKLKEEIASRNSSNSSSNTNKTTIKSHWENVGYMTTTSSGISQHYIVWCISKYDGEIYKTSYELGDVSLQTNYIFQLDDYYILLFKDNTTKNYIYRINKLEGNVITYHDYIIDNTNNQYDIALVHYDLSRKLLYFRKLKSGHLDEATIYSIPLDG